MSGTISKTGLGPLQASTASGICSNTRVLQALVYACLTAMFPWAALAGSADVGWLYVLDPRVELRVHSLETQKCEYELQIFGRSPGVPDDLLDVFRGTLERKSEKVWVHGGTLRLEGKPGDPTLRMHLKGQGSYNWSARKRNFYSGKESNTLILVPTGVLPGVTGQYENRGESGPSYDEHLTLQETPGGVRFDIEFAMAGEELVNQSARRISKDTFLFRRSISTLAQKDDLAELRISILESTDETNRNAERLARRIVLNAGNEDALSFPWNRINNRIYQKLAPGGVASRAFRLRSKPLKLDLLQGLEKAEKADALFTTDGEKAVAMYLEAATQLGGGIGLAQAFADRRGQGEHLRSAIRNAGGGVDFGLETLWRELGWSHGDLYIDPAFVLKMHRDAGVNPEERQAAQWELMQLAMEAGPFDLNAFLIEHHLNVEDLRASPYAIWELAQEVSKGGRFGKANATLALQLVLRGGGTVEERETAIRQCHAILKGARREPFELGECIRSRVGKAYLLSRSGFQREVTVAEISAVLQAKLETNVLRTAFAKASKCAETYAEAESQHYSGCRGFFTWESNRVAYKKSVLLAFFEDVSSVLAGKMADKFEVIENSEATLGELMKSLSSFMKGPLEEVVQDDQDPAPGDSFYYGEETEAEPGNTVWTDYRDALAQLLYAIRPDQSERVWTEWLNTRRIKFLLRFKNQNH